MWRGISKVGAIFVTLLLVSCAADNPKPATPTVAPTAEEAARARNAQATNRFVQNWCEMSRIASQDAFHTVAELMALVQKDNCADAAAILVREKDIRLSGKGISNIQPLIDLPQIEKLDLSSNQLAISQVLAPLHRLRNLKELNLTDNGITTLSDTILFRLSSLQVLNISKNEIEALPRVPPSLTTLNIAFTALPIGDAAATVALTFRHLGPTNTPNLGIIIHSPRQKNALMSFLRTDTRSNRPVLQEEAL